MTTITVLDSAGATQTVAKVLDTGRAAATASLPAVLSTEDKTALDAAVTALQIMDDWDETDRAKANIIVGQAGVAAGAGAVGATVQRMTLASDDPAVVDLAAIEVLLSSTNTQLNWGFTKTVAPTVTSGAYTANDVVGGALTFSDVARANDESFLVTNIVVAVKAAVTSTLRMVFFSAAPTVMADNAAYSLSGTDVLLVREDVTGFTLADHGTPNTYTWRGTLTLKPNSGARTLTAYLVDGTGWTLTSTSDIQVTISGVGA